MDWMSMHDDVLNEVALRLEEVRAAWDEAGRPLLARGSMGQDVEHPLVKLLRDTEAHLHRLQGGKGVGGRPVGAASAPDRREGPPKVRLKAV